MTINSDDKKAPESSTTTETLYTENRKINLPIKSIEKTNYVKIILFIILALIIFIAVGVFVWSELAPKPSNTRSPDRQSQSVEANQDKQLSSGVPGHYTKTLESGHSITLPGGSLCMPGNVFPQFTYDNNCLDAGYKYLTYGINNGGTFQRSGSEYTFKVTKCTLIERQFEEEKWKAPTDCEINIDIKKLDYAATSQKPVTFTKDITLGDGIYIENNSLYGEATNTRDPLRISVPPILNKDPLVQFIPYLRTDSSDTFTDRFTFFWKSPERCGKIIMCDRFEEDGHLASSLDQRYWIATRRGFATIDFSVNEMYNHASKSIDLDHATLTMKADKVFYSEDCGYCTETPMPLWGELYNRVQYTLSYVEKS